MKSFVLPVLAGLACLASGVTADVDYASQLSGVLSDASNAILQELQAEEATLAKRGIQASCTIRNIAIRREFGSLAPSERKAYTDAVLCLMNKTELTPRSLIPGVRNRFDDFVAAHQNQTPFIHYSGTFLGWHRYYVWEYEKALREECGYQGYQPYWDWPKWMNAPQDSPIFDGSPYSMSDRGEFIPGHPGLSLVPPPGSGNPTINIPAGYGGGCVTKGPFANMTVNLGPIGLSTGVPGPDGGFGYNPRCLKRDVGPWPSQTWCNYTRIFTLMAQTPTIKDFLDNLMGPAGSGDLGPHGGGHFTIAGDPGADVFTSPGDPAFYLHHGQVDRMWTLWQALDPSTRQYALSGTNTMLNNPPSANTTLDDVINLGYAGGVPLPIRDVMSTTKGPFCYIYA
ncbi:hypothetical protein BGZ60DRAFT_473728 [Tricladium varicosporioides]|nr:hypothetical protein BGZ60DRAFT_473728 [Hymenoscyphus varicosporioides]